METISRYVLTFLVNSLWQPALIGALAILGCRLMAKSPAAHRHIVWTAALIASVLLPLSSIRVSHRGAPMQVTVSYAPQSPAPPAAASSSDSMNAARGAARADSIGFARRGAEILLSTYALFLLIRLAYFRVAWMNTVRLRRGALRRPLPPALEATCSRCETVFGTRQLEVLASNAIPGPVTVGVMRPAILLPEALFAESSSDVLTTAIGHEAAHIARRDFALNILLEFLSIPISFHPAVWLMRRRIEQAREMACDELVICRLMDSAAYARSMIAIAATAAPVAPGYTLGVFDGDILEQRIRRLLDRRTVDLKRARVLFAATLSAIAACGIAASGLAVSAWILQT